MWELSVILHLGAELFSRAPQLQVELISTCSDVFGASSKFECQCSEGRIVIFVEFCLSKFGGSRSPDTMDVVDLCYSDSDSGSLRRTINKSSRTADEDDVILIHERGCDSDDDGSSDAYIKGHVQARYPSPSPHTVPLEMDILDGIFASNPLSQSQSQSLPNPKRARAAYNSGHRADYGSSSSFVSSCSSSSNSYQQRTQPAAGTSSSASSHLPMSTPVAVRAPSSSETHTASSSLSAVCVYDGPAGSVDNGRGSGKRQGNGVGVVENYHRISMTIEKSFPGSATLADLLENPLRSSATEDTESTAEGESSSSSSSCSPKAKKVKTKRRVSVSRKHMHYPGIMLFHVSQWAKPDMGAAKEEGRSRGREVVEHYYPLSLCRYSAHTLVEFAMADEKHRFNFPELNEDLDRMIACGQQHGARPYANVTLVVAGLDAAIAKFLKTHGRNHDRIYNQQLVSIVIDEALSSILIDRKISTHHVADAAEMATYVQHFHESFDTSQSANPLTYLDGVNKGKMFKLKEGNKTEAEQSREIWANQLVKLNGVAEGASKALASWELTSCPMHVYNFMTYGNIAGTGSGNTCEEERQRRVVELQNCAKSAGLKFHRIIGTALGELFSPEQEGEEEA